MRIELSGPWTLTTRGNVWALDCSGVTVYEIEGVGSPREAADAAALWLRNCADEVDEVAYVLPDEVDDED